MSDINTSPDKLKQSILQEAMQGKLTQQSSQDGDTSDLLQSIDEEKQRLIKAGKIKKQKKLSPVRDDEVPFSIPDNWQWTRLNNIGLIISGGTPKKSKVEYWNDKYLPWITPKFLGSNQNHKSLHDTNQYISKRGLTNSSAQFIEKESIAFSSRAPIGYINIVDFNYSTNQGVKSITPLKINRDYLYYSLKERTDAIKEQGSGTTFKEVSKTTLSNSLIPIPPLAEQKRIVDKLDELLPKVASLKQSVNSIQSLRNELPSRLRRSFLQSAMQGKLTQQSSHDGDASDLLQSIDEEKQRLIKAGKIKKQKKLSPVGDEEKPFSIPNNWQWIRIPEISSFPDQYSIRPSDISISAWVLDLKEIEENTGKILSKEYNYNKRVKSSKKIFKKNDVLFNKLRPYLNKVLVAPESGVATSELFVIHLLGGINSKYIAHALQSPNILNKINEDTYGTKMPRAGTKQFSHYLLPLPPLTEQKRIVNKLDSMFEHINNM